MLAGACRVPRCGWMPMAACTREGVSAAAAQASSTRSSTGGARSACARDAGRRRAAFAGGWLVFLGYELAQRDRAARSCCRASHAALAGASRCAPVRAASTTRHADRVLAVAEADAPQRCSSGSQPMRSPSPRRGRRARSGSVPVASIEEEPPSLPRARARARRNTSAPATSTRPISRAPGACSCARAIAARRAALRTAARGEPGAVRGAGAVAGRGDPELLARAAGAHPGRASRPGPSPARGRAAAGPADDAREMTRARGASQGARRAHHADRSGAQRSRARVRGRHACGWMSS